MMLHAYYNSFIILLYTYNKTQCLICFQMSFEHLFIVKSLGNVFIVIF